MSFCGRIVSLDRPRCLVRDRLMNKGGISYIYWMSLQMYHRTSQEKQLLRNIPLRLEQLAQCISTPIILIMCGLSETEQRVMGGCQSHAKD